MRADKLSPPLGFGAVCNGVYRSSYPNHRTWTFLLTLNIKSVISLQPADIKDDLRQFLNNNNIELIQIDIGYNQEPFVIM